MNIRRSFDGYYLEGKPSSPGLISLLIRSGIKPTGNAMIDVKKARTAAFNHDVINPDIPKAKYEAAKKIWRNNKDEL